ncbi:MAG: cation:proton antiporter [Ginsengibacter sp.]
MGHLPSLIEDLALILIAAALTTLLFKKIKQPLVLGYIIAGVLVGPYLSLTPTIVDTENIKVLAQMGVIFLLFNLGLEFSFKKLMRVGGSASVTALIEISCMAISGYYLGKWMGWSNMDSLFLGGMVAGSSTTIIIKAFDELGLKTRQFARVVFGVLVIEDIVVIMLMVMLSTVAVTKQFEGSEMLFIVAKLLFFLVLWFIGGIFLIPTLLKKAKKFLDDETLLILSLGLCLSMVVLATQAGFSAELGAFIMGSILAETVKAEKIEHLLKPVKDLFGAIFFVSVGMLIDPQAIIEYRWPVLWVTLLVLFGKLFGVTLGALISGQPLKQSIEIGMSMAQIGEFAFIVATLGLTLGVISEFLFPVAIGVSAITTFTTPYRIKFSIPLYNFLEKNLPAKWIKALNNYSSSTQNIQAESDWKKVLKSYLGIAITNGIILLAILLLADNFLIPFLNRNIENNITRNIILFTITMATCAPFLWAFMAKRPNKLSYKELWLHKKYSRGPLLILEIIRSVIGVLFISIWINKFFPTGIAFIIVIVLIIAVLLFFSNRIQKFYDKIETRFITNLNARETFALKEEEKQKILLEQFNPKADLSPWDAHMVDVQVNPHADYLGKTLLELQWRERFGVNIAYIKRGDNLIYAPGRNNRLLPFDHVGIIATDEQMLTFQRVLDAKESIDLVDDDIEEIILKKIVVDEFNKLKGLSIRESQIRERTNGLIVGIERDGNRILNPDSAILFEWGDIVWIVGERKKIQRLKGGKAEPV